MLIEGLALLQVKDSLVLGDLLLHHLDLFIAHSFLFDHDVLNELVEFKLFTQQGCLSRLDLISTEVDAFDLLENPCEFGDEIDTVLNLDVLHGKLEAAIRLHHPETTLGLVLRLIRLRAFNATRAKFGCLFATRVIHGTSE